LSSGLSDGVMDPRVFAAVAACPHLGELRRLSLYRYGRGNSDAELEALAASPHLPRLEDLDLRDSRFREPALQALIASPHRAALRTLRVRGVGMRDTYAHLSQSGRLRRALERRFGAGCLDFRSRYPWWDGQRWTDRALVHTPLS